MQEDRAAPAPHTRSVVPVQNDDDIVEPILARQALGAGREGQSDMTVIGGMAWRVAPAVSPGPDRARRKGTFGPWHSAAAMPHLKDGHMPDGRCTVAFALHAGGSAPSEGTAHSQGTDRQYTALRTTRSPTNGDRVNRLTQGREKSLQIRTGVVLSLKSLCYNPLVPTWGDRRPRTGSRAASQDERTKHTHCRR